MQYDNIDQRKKTIVDMVMKVGVTKVTRVIMWAAVLRIRKLKVNIKLRQSAKITITFFYFFKIKKLFLLFSKYKTT